MKILITSAEVVPFAKTGGLADVAGALPLALQELGHDVCVAMPKYGRVGDARFGLTNLLDSFPVPLDGQSGPAAVKQGFIGTDIPVYMLANEHYFDREGIYGYEDDGERFIFFCRAALEALKRLDWQPDIIHCHDWHTGVIPNWLKTIYKSDPFFAQTASVFTIHNLQYQGIFGKRVLEIAGLEDYGFIVHPTEPALSNVIDLMARGVIFADVITTVSERYAQEILTPEYGEKLDFILRDHQDRLFGVLNGIDVELMNPATDKYIAVNYGFSSLDKRVENKLALQREANLPVGAEIPLLGVIGRLADQKGFDILEPAIDHILDMDVQFILLGTGDPHYHQMFTKIAQSYSQKAAIFLTFNAPLAQKIYAGCDLFLMPSRFEPCGLGQMIAMRYGAVPVVRATGGLADTVHNFDARTVEGNGFTFSRYDRWALFAAVVRALETYRHQEVWRKLQINGMSTDFSWHKSAKRYVELYQKALEFKRAALGSSESFIH